MLDSIRVDNSEDIETAYKALNTVERCGPNFFSKHLYFLGKAASQVRYPLIFDDRVALGLARLAMPDASCTGFITIHAKAKSNAYLEYLAFAHDQADRIKCKPDQIEYFLFEQGARR